MIIFGAAIGLLWLSTVPPTSGLVALMFGTRFMATLFGLVFFRHQVGAFLGVWLGGVALRAHRLVRHRLVDRGGARHFRRLVHLPIAERPVARLAPAPA